MLSHVEVWPWRVVVRGLVANPEFDPQPMQLPEGFEEGPVGVGRYTAEVIHADDQRLADWRRSLDWMNSWSLTDDAGHRVPPHDVERQSGR